MWANLNSQVLSPRGWNAKFAARFLTGREIYNFNFPFSARLMENEIKSRLVFLYQWWRELPFVISISYTLRSCWPVEDPPPTIWGSGGPETSLKVIIKFWLEVTIYIRHNLARTQEKWYNSAQTYHINLVTLLRGEKLLTPTQCSPTCEVQSWEQFSQDTIKWSHDFNLSSCQRTSWSSHRFLYSSHKFLPWLRMCWFSFLSQFEAISNLAKKPLII